MNHKRIFQGRTRPTPPRGLTIIETMVAMVVLAIGLVSVAGMTASVSEQTQNNRMYSIASALAAQLMEEVRTYGCNPRINANACDRLRTHYEDPSRKTRLYCMKDKGSPIELRSGETCDNGIPLLGSILVRLPNPGFQGTNTIGYDRMRISNGTPNSVAVELDNIANIRVSVRWNDVSPNGTIIPTKRPMFAAYQTRVTQ